MGAEIKNSVYTNEKVYISDHTPCWHNGDRVNINGSVYSIVAASGTSAQIPEVTRHDTYRAIFPASIVNSNSTNISNNSDISVTLPSVQYFQMVGNHQRVDVPMGAYMTSGSTLQFYNLCSVVRVTVSNSLNTDLSLSSIILHAAQARLSGTGTVTVTGAESNSIRMNSNSTVNTHTVSLVFTEDAPAIVDALGSSTFDIVVPAFTTDDIEITINTTDGQYYILPKNNVGLTHNTITTVTANITELYQYPTAAELISGPAFNNLIPSTATSVEFLYETPWVVSGTLLSTSNSAAPIYGNLVGDIWRITTPARSINANTNCSQMFKNKNNLQSISFNSRFNTCNVTNMSSMFEGCSHLSNLDLSSFNTSNVTNMSSMFEGCAYDYYGLSSINLSSFNTSNVTNMSKMFKGCSHLSSLNLSNFNTQNVTDMSSMFEDCVDHTDDGFLIGLYNIDLSSFNTSNVTNMSKMFKGCSHLSSLNLSNFNTQNVTDMSYMFYRTSKLDAWNWINGLSSLDLSNFNTSSVTNMSYMFGECVRISSLNLSNFDMSNVTSKTGMCSNLSICSVDYNDLENTFEDNACTITCPLSVQTAMQNGTNLPTSGVTFTWVRP